MSTRPTVRELLADGWCAIWRPARVLARIPERPALPYGRLVVCMTLWGIPYAFLHFRAMEGVWLWEHWNVSLARWRTVAFMVISVNVWLLASLGPALLARLLRRPVPQGRLDVAAFYLWMVWALMPLADAPHLLLGWPRRNLILPLPVGGHLEFMAHTAWLVAFPLLIWQTACVLQSLLGLRRWLPALLAAASMVLCCRVLLEPMIMVLWGLGQRQGWMLGPWQAHALCAAAMLVVACAVRWWLANHQLAAKTALRAAVAAVVVAAGLVFGAAPALAVTRVWDGGGTTTNASEGANWCNADADTNDNVVPAAGDDIRFGGADGATATCKASTGIAKSCAWDINLSGYALNSWTMSATTNAYGGTVTLGQALPISFGFTLASGTLDAASVSIEAESYSQTGGTLTANGSLLQVGSFSKTGGTFTAGSSTINLIGGIASNLVPGASTYNNITVTTSTYTLTTNNLNLSGTLTLSSGGLNTSGSNLAIVTTAYSQGGGTLTLNDSVLTVNGSFTKTGGTLSAGTSLVDFRTAGNANFNPGGVGTTYYDVQIIKGAGNAITLQNDLVVSNQLILTSASSGAISPGAYTIYLDKASGTVASQPFYISAANDLIAGTGKVVYRSTGTTDIAYLNYYNLEIDKAGVTFNLAAGVATTVSNFLFLRGVPSSKLTLRSTSAGTKATLTVTGTTQADSVDANDLDCGGGHNTINATDSTLGANITAGCWAASTRLPGAPVGTPATY